MISHSRRRWANQVPNSLMTGSPLEVKLAKTVTMIAAAMVEA
jgi:hypothetical protein